MTEQKQAELTLGERRYLEPVGEAQSEGVSLRDYYLTHGLSLRMLSRVQGRLMNKGIVPPATSAAAEAGKPGKLIEVRVAESWAEPDSRRQHRCAGYAIRAGG